MEWNGARVGVGALHARLGIVIEVVQVHTALGVLSPVSAESIEAGHGSKEINSKHVNLRSCRPGPGVWLQCLERIEEKRGG